MKIGTIGTNFVKTNKFKSFESLMPSANKGKRRPQMGHRKSTVEDIIQGELHEMETLKNDYFDPMEGLGNG